MTEENITDVPVMRWFNYTVPLWDYHEDQVL